ncbi:hypothetical protein [Marinagarivorans cellulosilyticus]|uniref:hypothetical protein n=1 Tax=Marinagarivorans cellulosilyticus TaxID=2721545 RepID=UPI001F2F4226|nr:hypothetical protein [Marinagarivorans cellulosilyticus]
MGEFTSTNVDWWISFDFPLFRAYWSGEVGAAILYLPKTSGNKLFAAAKLKKAVRSV